jgi:DNA-binding MarR family transcriptional regulator
MYNRELRSAQLELTQFTLLMTLDLTGETTQKALGKVLAIDSTTLTRTLSSLIKSGWIAATPGEDRREKRLSLTKSGKRKYEQARVDWQHAQRKLRMSLGETTWSQMGQLLDKITGAAEPQ